MHFSEVWLEGISQVYDIRTIKGVFLIEIFT